MAGKKLELEVLRALGGGRSDLLDLYWLARHGQPIPPEAWPAVLAIRHAVEGSYLPAESYLSTLLSKAETDDAQET